MAISEMQQEIIKKAAQKFQPKFIGVFGSFARGDQAEDSDLDILIDFEENVNLIDLIGLEQELSELLGLKVDLITQKSIYPPLKPIIENDLIRIF
jgi:predicted nucleotidyltransferase